MIVFITQKLIRDKHQQVLDGLEQKYIAYLKKILPKTAVFIPIINDVAHVRRLVDMIKPDLLIITGGNDVQPTRKEDNREYDICPIRDEVEGYLIDYADENNIFKLAICRGFQFLNVYYGGSLSYQLNNHPPGIDHICLYEDKEYNVNSYHRQGVHKDNMAPCLKPIAFSERDHLVEAYISQTDTISPTLAAQWHPERKQFPVDLFKILWSRYYNESNYSSRRKRL